MTSSHFYDTLSRLFRDASRDPLEIPVSHLAGAIGRKLLFPCDEVIVIWQMRTTPESETSFPALGAWWRKEEDATGSLPNEKIKALTLETDWKRFERNVKLLHFSGVTDHAERTGVVLSEPRGADGLSRTDNAGELWILLRHRGQDDQDLLRRINVFQRNITGLGMLYRAFTALCVAGEPARLAQRVAELTSDTGDAFLIRLAEAEEILYEIGRYWHGGYKSQYADLVVQLAEAVMLEMLGRGWDVQNLEGDRGVKAIGNFLEHLDDFIGDDRGLKAIRVVIGTAIDKGQEGKFDFSTETGKTKHVALELMACWARLYQGARRLAKSAGPEANEDSHDEKDFLELVQLSLAPIGWFLREHFRRAAENPERIEEPRASRGFKMTYLSSWLRLWLCHTLLVKIRTDRGFRKRSVSNAQQWRFRADLAYVIRESLRFFVYGRNPHFTFPPAAFSAALRTLVENHAVWVVKLPQEHDIRGLLREIGRIGLGGRVDFAASHLQHVLEMYIGGQFLYEMRVRPGKSMLDVTNEESWKKGEWTLGDVLAGRSTWQPGALKVGEFRKAFSLAVLLHDVGMLLFPYWTRRTEDLGEVDAVLSANLRSIRETLHSAAGQLLRVCERELREEGYFDPTLEPRLAAWIDDAIEHGGADHCVLGAWYLHRICQDMEGLSSDTLYQAVRAVLLHRIVTQKIRVDDDPVAALLMLCDEIFMWHQGHEPPQPDDVGRFSHAIAGEVRPQTSVFQELWIHGLELEAVTVPSRNAGKAASKPVKRLVGRLKLDDETTLKTRQGQVWPHFDITLGDPDYLPIPVYRIWLTTAQNLGRIEPSQFGCGPALTLHSKIPGRMHQANLDTHKLLEQAANQTRLGLRPCLERWLARRSIFPRREPGESDENTTIPKNADSDASGGDAGSQIPDEVTWETVNILPLPVFHNQDISRSFDELERIVEAVRHDEALRAETERQRKTVEDELMLLKEGSDSRSSS